MAKITVLITVRNGEDTIKRCLESVVNQTRGDFKVIVVDACSTDRTYDIIKEFGDRFYFVDGYMKSGWAPECFNWVIENLVDTEYVAFTDADCEVDKKWLTNLLKGFKKGVVATAGWCGSGKPRSELESVIGKELENRYEELKDGQFIPRAATMNLMVKTDALKKTMFNEKLKVAFETDFGCRLQKQGKMRYVKNAKVYHHHRATWEGLAKQQFDYGVYQVAVGLKTMGCGVGDHVSKNDMYFDLIGFFVSWLLLPVTWGPIVAFTILVSIIYFSESAFISPGQEKTYILFSWTRLLAWAAALPIGVIKYVIGETR